MIDLQRSAPRRSVPLHIHHVAVDEKAVSLVNRVLCAYGDDFADALLNIAQLQFLVPMPRNYEIRQIPLMEAIRVLHRHPLYPLNLVLIRLKQTHSMVPPIQIFKRILPDPSEYFYILA